jgi:hypothetical protein
MCVCVCSQECVMIGSCRVLYVMKESKVRKTNINSLKKAGVKQFDMAFVSTLDHAHTSAYSHKNHAYAQL